MKSKNHGLALLVLISLVLLNSSSAHAWDEKVTHRDLSRIAAEKSVLGTQNLLAELGFPKGLAEKISAMDKDRTISAWIMDGRIPKFLRRGDWRLGEGNGGIDLGRFC